MPFVTDAVARVKTSTRGATKHTPICVYKSMREVMIDIVDAQYS